MKVVLELLDQNSNIKKVTVRHDIVIGRGAECNLRLSSPQVSRRHCFLRISSDGAFISDLDSSNGTFLNNEKLASGSRVEISDGAALSVGPVKFVAYVRSDAVADKPLQVDIADDRIEVDEESEQDAVDNDYQATIAHPVEEQDVMDFSVEHVGPSADDDDPTADYVPTTGESANLFHDIEEETSNFDSSMLDDDPTTSASDAQPPQSDSTAGHTESNAVIESVEIISIRGNDLEIDDADVADVVAEISPVTEAASAAKEDDDDDETQLRNFLNGLD